MPHGRLFDLTGHISLQPVINDRSCNKLEWRATFSRYTVISKLFRVNLTVLGSNLSPVFLLSRSHVPKSWPAICYTVKPIFHQTFIYVYVYVYNILANYTSLYVTSSGHVHGRGVDTKHCKRSFFPAANFSRT